MDRAPQSRRRPHATGRGGLQPVVGGGADIPWSGHQETAPARFLSEDASRLRCRDGRARSELVDSAAVRRLHRRAAALNGFTSENSELRAPPGRRSARKILRQILLPVAERRLQRVAVLVAKGFQLIRADII